MLLVTPVPFLPQQTELQTAAVEKGLMFLFETSEAAPKLINVDDHR